MLLEFLCIFAICALVCYWVLREKLASRKEIVGTRTDVSTTNYQYVGCIVVKNRTDKELEKKVCTVRDSAKLISPTKAFCFKIWKELEDLDIKVDYFTICNEGANIVVFEDGEMRRYVV